MRVLRDQFDEWAKFTGGKLSGRQWLLAKWEVFEGIDWPPEKIELMLMILSSRLNLKPGHILADVGCGGGWILQALLPQAGYAFGVDFSAQMLANARQVVPFSRLVQGDIGALPLRGESVDRLLCYFVLVNMMDDGLVERALLELTRVLKPGGIALVGQLPDASGSSDYNAAKAAYMDYCQHTFPVGASYRDVERMPQKLFDMPRLEAFLQARGIAYHMEPSFNPFYRPGEPSTVWWRKDLVIEKR